MRKEGRTEIVEGKKMKQGEKEGRGQKIEN